MLGLDSARTVKVSDSVLMHFCVLMLPHRPKKVSARATTCVPGLGQGDEGGGWRKISAQKKQNPNPKWFILGFPVSECLLKNTGARTGIIFGSETPFRETRPLGEQCC